MKIKKIKAFQIIDSRGWPTIKVLMEIKKGIVSSSSPSGKSKGKFEAKEARDGGKRYFGKGVLKAVEKINREISRRIEGKNFKDQNEFDSFLLNLDKTQNKKTFGANAILPISLCFAKAKALSENIPLYFYLRKIFDPQNKEFKFPFPAFNILNGGAHAQTELDIQEFMIIPQFSSFERNLQAGVEVYHQLKKILEKKFSKSATNLGDEGGFAPPFKKTYQALDFLLKAIEKRSYQRKIKLALDCASSQFFKEGKYYFERKILDAKKLAKVYQKLIGSYPILFLEDPFSERDYKGWENFKKLKKEIYLIGDDLTVTNPLKIKLALKRDLIDGLVIKPNQIGTLTETLEAVKLAKENDLKIVVSHRSGETNDTFISDLALGISADFIKAGAPARGERVAKYNRLLEIEKFLKVNI